MNAEKIRTRIFEDYKLLQSKGYEVLGVFLQGSQNYNLSHEGSDIDTKAIIVPSYADLIALKQPVSTTIILPNEEHIDVKDIRLMFNEFKKSNINFVEILFTKYYYINPEYRALFKPMFDNAELIARCNPIASVNATFGTIHNKVKILLNAVKATGENAIDLKTVNKQFSHIMRCEDFLKRYIAHTPYRDCLVPVKAEEILAIKTNCPYSAEEAYELGQECEAKVLKLKDAFMEPCNEEICNTMDQILLNICSYRTKKDLQIE